MKTFRFATLGKHWLLEETFGGIVIYREGEYVTTLRKDFIEELYAFLKSILEKQEE